jgi:bifunctional non-homologous end joining protein LigD
LQQVANENECAGLVTWAVLPASLNMQRSCRPARWTYEIKHDVPLRLPTYLELDSQDLRREQWETRRATLASRLRKVEDGVRLSEHLTADDGEAVYHPACRMGLEGIVAKRRDRPYNSGRSPDWVKVKAAMRLIEG